MAETVGTDGQDNTNVPVVVNDVAPAAINVPAEVPAEAVEASSPSAENKTAESEAKPVPAAEAASVPAVEPVVAKDPTSKAKYLHFAAEAVLLVAVVILGTQLAGAKSDAKNLQTQLAGVNSNPQALVQKQSDDIIAKVGALMKLPAGETPTVAAVSDAGAAKQQSPFFANAANGDKVLLYVKAGEAILYRPSTNKIILVAPLTFNNAQASATTKK